MPFRFRRGVRLAKGVRLNIGKRGPTSVSFGRGRVRTSIGRYGVHNSVRLARGVSYGCLLPLLAGGLALAVLAWLVA